MELTLENFISLIAAREWVTGPVTADSAFSDLGFDHLDEIELILECEEEFNASLADEHMLNAPTVAAFHQAILASFVA